MVIMYITVCMPTKCVSWFNSRGAALGTVVLLITTILLLIKASPNINLANDVFTLAYNQTGWLSDFIFHLVLELYLSSARYPSNPCI